MTWGKESYLEEWGTGAWDRGIHRGKSRGNTRIPDFVPKTRLVRQGSDKQEREYWPATEGSRTEGPVVGFRDEEERSVSNFGSSICWA